MRWKRLKSENNFFHYKDSYAGDNSAVVNILHHLSVNDNRFESESVEQCKKNDDHRCNVFIYISSKC